MIQALAFAVALTSGHASPATTIQTLFQAFNRHDVVSLQRLYSASAILNSSDFCHPRTGADVTRTYAAIFREYPDIQDRVDTVIIEGDRAAVRFTSQSHVPGKEFTLKLMTFLRLGDQGILEDDTLFDTKGRPCDP